MTYSELSVPSNGRLSFSLRVDNTQPWWRDLDLDREPLYRIGNICDTCEAIMGKFKDAKFPIAPAELSQQLREGLEVVSQPVIETISQILPKGKYVVSLLDVQPALVKFHPWHSDEIIYLWLNATAPFVLSELLPDAEQIYPLWGVENDAIKFPEIDKNRLYEALFPLVEESQLNRSVIENYKLSMVEGLRPTALAFSVVDVRFPSGRGFEWQLAHFLLDGHHKVMAASELDQPLTILSFLNTDESFAGSEYIDDIIKLRYEP
jgi:hypothetical protein